MTTDPTSVPPMPVELDNAMYEAMIDAVGETLAFRAVEAAWIVLVEWFHECLTERALEETHDGS